MLNRRKRLKRRLHHFNDFAHSLDGKCIKNAKEKNALVIEFRIEIAFWINFSQRRHAMYRITIKCKAAISMCWIK